MKLQERKPAKLHIPNVEPRTIAPIACNTSNYIHLTSACVDDFAAHIFWSRSHLSYLVRLEVSDKVLYLNPLKLDDAPDSKFTPADLVYIHMQAENYARDYLKQPYLYLEFKMSKLLPTEFENYWEYHFAATVPGARQIIARCLTAH
tara:strand:+ start:399 stop:839 length:441 start_codon:yes stop_codon:yes gene_type:complete